MFQPIKALGSGQSSPLPATDLPAAQESPSLSAGVEAPAFELKFLLTESQAREVESRVQGRLVPDTHADPQLGNAYRTASLYFDTAELDVFHRRGRFKRQKHRVRRYEISAGVFLERKSKRGTRVRKRRTLIADDDLLLLSNPMSVVTWPGHWFHRHLLQRQLRPVCRIAYERVALVGQAAEGPLRLTFDRNVQGVFTRDWNVAPVEGGIPLLTGQVICEFKYQVALPILFKETMIAMRLTPRPASKYRTFLCTTGEVPEKKIVQA